jgi:hypothetical protein
MGVAFLSALSQGFIGFLDFRDKFINTPQFPAAIIKPTGRICRLGR